MPNRPVTLVQCELGDRVKVFAMAAGQGATLDLMNMGLNIGDEIELVQRSPFRGPLLIQHDGTRIAIGFRMAQQILVRKSG